MSTRDELDLFTGSEIRIRDNVRFKGQVAFENLPAQPITRSPVTITTLPVLSVTRLQLTNTASVTVTDLLYGQEGQEVKILGDGFTTITNGTKMKTNTGTNKLLSANKVYTFTRFNNVWIENG